MWDLVPRPGIELSPLRQECRVLATGLPGKSLATAISYELIWAYEKTTLS